MISQNTVRWKGRKGWPEQFFISTYHYYMFCWLMQNLIVLNSFLENDLNQNYSTSKLNVLFTTCMIHVIWTECWISKLVLNVQHLLFLLFFNFVRVLQFGAYSRHYKGVLTQKRSFIVICTDFRSNLHVGWKNHNKHSTLNLTFDGLFKWHEPDIN